MRSNQEIASDIVKRHRFDEGEENTVEVDRSGLIGDIAEALTTAGTPEAQRNRYDRRDRVKQEAMMRAAGLKIAAYRVRDPETDEWSPIQFRMTHDNTVMGMLSEASGRLFANFIRQTLGEEPGMFGRERAIPAGDAALDSARQYVAEALEQFAKYPADDAYEAGYHGALHAIGIEALGMTLSPLDPPPHEKPKQVSHLHLVK